MISGSQFFLDLPLFYLLAVFCFHVTLVEVTEWVMLPDFHQTRYYAWCQ